MRKLPGVVAVVGAGTMGVGIARVFAQAGCAVRLTSRRAESVRAARERLGSVAHRVLASTSIDETLAGAELVIRRSPRPSIRNGSCSPARSSLQQPGRS